MEENAYTYANVIILEGPAGRPGRVAEPAVGQLAGGPKGQIFDQKGGKRCTRLQNVLISEVPPAAAGRGGPEMIFFCTNDFSLYVQRKVIHMRFEGLTYMASFLAFPGNII